MRHTLLALIVACIAPLLPARAADYPDTAAGLELLTGDIMKEMKDGKPDAAKELIKGFALPDAKKFFTTTWGDEKGGALADKYEKVAASMPNQMFKMFQSQLDQNRTNVKAYKVEKPDDHEATGSQKEAITAMKTKTPLYGVRMIAPGHEMGMHLWSFAYVDGGFRLIGKTPMK
jgi:hypothetical protein